MFEQFPYTNFHELNMDWLVKIAKDFLDQYTHIQDIIAQGEQSLTDKTTEGLAALADKADELEALLQQWYDTHSEDISNKLADALADFQTEADQIVAQTIASIPSDYSTFYGQAVKNMGEAHPNTFSSCDDIDTNTIYFISSSSGILSIPDAPNMGWIHTIPYSGLTFQILYPLSESNIIKYRMKFGSWTSWKNIDTTYPVETFLTNKGEAHSGDYSSVNNLPNNSILFVTSNQGIPTIPDAPGIGWIQTVKTLSLEYQLFIPYDANNKPKYRIKNINDVWSNWIAIGSGETVTNVQEVSRDTYNNTYNITTSPQISTSTNGWLQAVDTDTASETGKTDMTGAIMSMLQSTGYCHLSEGIFYVSGGIDMPGNSILEGCGSKTILRLLQNSSADYIVRCHTRSTIRSIRFTGGRQTPDLTDPSIGSRKGIIYIGNRDGKSSGVTPSTCTTCIIEDCFFENLDSAIYGYNAGGGNHEGFIINNCFVLYCKAGINIDYWTEYCKISNTIISYCYYACINNGGNNSFDNCSFTGVIGFLIDNSGNNKQNIGHGILSNCTLNHIDNMHSNVGDAIKILNNPHGFIIEGCQMWYGKVTIQNSEGIQINGNTFGGDMSNVIKTSGTGTVFLMDNLFQTRPTLDIQTNTIARDNYTFNGTQVTI